MSKTEVIDLSADRLLSIAADMVDDHNYIGALKMLNKNAGITGNDEYSYMLYAEIFDDLALYEKSVHNWFKYMDLTDGADLSDCYEGLAVGYMNMGNEQFSAFYYNKLLLESDEVDSDQREQILQDFLSTEENPLKFVYPPEIADVSDIMSAGLKHMKEGEFDKAYEQFGQVAEGNPNWGAARNYMAMCLIVQDKNEQAEQECLKVLEKQPDNVQALTTLAAVKTESGNRDEAYRLTRKLLSLDLDDTDEIYKIATVCCENGLHEQAYNLFCKMDDEYGYDLNILYFKAIAAFNCKKTDECFAAFDKLLTLYPDAITAQFYQRFARELTDSGEWQEMSYFYTLPQEVRQSSLKVLAAFLKLPKKQALKLAGQLDIYGLVKWCFDESGPNTFELQALGARACVKACLDDYARDLLLHPSLPDRLKIDMLITLAERNEENFFGVVICNVYKRISMHKLETGRQKSVYFVRAYARLIAHFSILNDTYGERFAHAAEDLYRELAAQGRLEISKDVDCLTAAIFEDSGVTDAGVTHENLCAFFDITKERLSKFRGNGD